MSGSTSVFSAAWKAALPCRASMRDPATGGYDREVAHPARALSAMAFALSRLADDRHSPTPVGVFRAVERIDYGAGIDAQIAQAQADRGPGDLTALLHSLPTWEVS